MSISDLSINAKKNFAMVTFLTQVIVVFTIMVASLINLTIDKEREKLWYALLAGSIGVILPTPKPPAPSI